MHMAFDLGSFPMETFLFITDGANSIASLFDHDFLGHTFRTAGFARQHHTVGGRKRFNGNTRIFVCGQKCVNNGIGNAVTNFVRVTFRNGFAGKKLFGK